MGIGAETRLVRLEAGREGVLQHTAPVTSHLARDNTRLADLVLPVTSSHTDIGELGQSAGPTDISGYLLRALDTKTEVSLVIPDGNKCLEFGLLASTRLLLHRHILQNLLLEECPGEKVSDLRPLDGQREEIVLLQGLDLHVVTRWPSLVTVAGVGGGCGSGWVWEWVGVGGGGRRGRSMSLALPLPALQHWPHL